MPFQVSPGVNVSEIDLTTVIPAVGTTTGAIAAHTVWGPANIRVLVDSEDTLVQTFGKPNSNTASDFFTAANFLAYGNSLYVVRVVENRDSGSTTKAVNATVSGNTASVVVDNSEDYENKYGQSGITTAGTWAAKYPGELGNTLKVSVCANTTAWQKTITGNVAVSNGSTSVTGNNTLFTSEIGVGDYLILGPGRVKVQVSAIGNTTSLTLASKYVGNNVTINATGSSGTVRRWEFYDYFDGAPGTSDYATLNGGLYDEMHVAVVDEDGKITGTADTVIERYSKLSAASDAKTADGSTNYYVDVINGQSQWIWFGKAISGYTGVGNKAAGQTFAGPVLANSVSLTGGKDGTTPASDDYIRGYNKFKNADEVDISFVLGGAADATRALHIIDNICEYRKDCIAVLSPERADVVNNASYPGKEVDDAIAFRNSLTSSSYATMDSGWKYQYDKYNDLYRYVPLNGDIAGLMVRTDNTRDPWYSPAGYNRGIIKNSIKLAFNPNKTERDQLYKSNINPVITQPGQGTLMFGDKTLLTKPSAFDRINVRRLFIVLEKAISTAAKFSLFEFNDAFTRAQFRNLVEPFLRDVQGRRGIYDFRVVCDETNNTGEVIDRNEFVGDIYIKPARSINFIQLNFVAVRTGVEFSEVVGQF